MLYKESYAAGESPRDRRQKGEAMNYEPPQVKRWPFYGRALQVIANLPVWPRDELCELEKAIEHRALVEKHLDAARQVVALLEKDLEAIDAVWPSEEHRQLFGDCPDGAPKGGQAART